MSAEKDKEPTPKQIHDYMEKHKGESYYTAREKLREEQINQLLDALWDIAEQALGDRRSPQAIAREALQWHYRITENGDPFKK